MRTSDQEVRYLRDEISHLRYELDERRARDEREQYEREQRQREERKRAHPSNRLYNGEISNFREAIETHIAALRLERNSPYVDGDDEETRKYRADFDGYIAAAQALLTEYDATVGAAERALFERWAASPEGSLAQTVGKGALVGDYTGLAV